MPFNSSYMANIAVLMMKDDVKLIKYFTSLAWLYCWQKKGQNRLQVLDTPSQPQGLMKKMRSNFWSVVTHAFTIYH